MKKQILIITTVLMLFLTIVAPLGTIMAEETPQPNQETVEMEEPVIEPYVDSNGIGIEVSSNSEESKKNQPDIAIWIVLGTSIVCSLTVSTINFSKAKRKGNVDNDKEYIQGNKE